MREVFAVADDLSGAAETAGALLNAGAGARILLDVPGDRGPRRSPVTVVDLDSRAAAPTDAARAVSRALHEGPRHAVVFKKLDSLLRGNVAAEVAALAATRPVVLACAVPGAGRTVRGGVVHVDGVPLHRTAHWRFEPAPPPVDVPAALGGLPVRTVGLRAVRADRTGLAEALAEVCDSGAVAVCDAADDADLDAIVAAAPPSARWAGAGGLAAALGRSLAAADRPRSAPDLAAGRPVLVVVGTAEASARAQVQRLLADGAAEITVPVARGAPVREELSAPVTVLRPDPDGGVHPDPVAVADRLARDAAALAPGAALVLTGGATARAVLRALGVPELEALCVVGEGAVCSRAPDGTPVITRPGSFGGPDSLRELAGFLVPHPRTAAVPRSVRRTTERHRS